MISSWVFRPGHIRLAAMLMLIMLAAPPLYSQHTHPASVPPDATMDQRHDHHHPPSTDQWEGSVEGKAYSEFNHHMAGTLVILIGISEIHSAMSPAVLTWTRFLLPAAMTAAGFFLLIWSDHDGWPIGSRGLAETFLTGDFETVQHKWFGILSLGIAMIEWIRRLGLVRWTWVRAALPAFAIAGGVSLFLHSHGDHPSAHQIAIHHAVMGIMAVTAGSSKLVSGFTWARPAAVVRSPWEFAWGILILLIGFQLLIYSE
jgi:hypothetical protein